MKKIFCVTLLGLSLIACRPQPTNPIPAPTQAPDPIPYASASPTNALDENDYLDEALEELQAVE